MIAIAVSLIIVAVLYFAVIKPNNDTANTAIKQSEQQVQQAVNQADKQSGGAVPQGVKDLTSCMAAAGSDTVPLSVAVRSTVLLALGDTICTVAAPGGRSCCGAWPRVTSVTAD